MISFMDYIVHAFGKSTDWNYDNSYYSLTATSDALLAFETPSTLALHVSSLSTPYFASSYTLSTLGQIDGSISYLYTTTPLSHIPSQTTNIPLRHLVRGYRDVRLPVLTDQSDILTSLIYPDARKPTLLFATLALPPPSTLTALYARRIDPKTLLSLSLHSKSITGPIPNSGPPPASILAHIQHDRGQYSIEGLGSTDSALLGVRGLWNFGLSPPKPEQAYPPNQEPSIEDSQDLDIAPSTTVPVLLSHDESQAAYRARLASKPSLLSAGAEFYYSPFSHVIGLSTGLRFTTLAPLITPMEPSSNISSSSSNQRTSKPRTGTSAALSQSFLAPSNVAHSSFPYTMTLTLTPLTGSIASTYSVRPTPNLALSSRCDFNFYSWESQYVVGAEIWRRRRRRRRTHSSLHQRHGHVAAAEEEDEDDVEWARKRTSDWFSPRERALKEERLDREEENVLKLRVDDTWNFRAMWTGRVKALLVSAGVSVSPGGVRNRGDGSGDDTGGKTWSGSVGVSVAYST